MARRYIPAFLPRGKMNELLGTRRKAPVPEAVDLHDDKRRSDPTTHEQDYSPAELEFLRAVDRYKTDNRRPFPTWGEVLAVLVALGYRRVAPPGPLPRFKRGAAPNSRE